MESSSVQLVRQGESFEPYDYSMLIIGASGSGKSTFVNSLINYLIGREPGRLTPVIACSGYPNVDPIYLDPSRPERNDPNTDKNQTCYAHGYKVCSSKTRGQTFLIVDTPGFGSDSGVADDDVRLQETLQFVRTIKSFNAIIIIAKSNDNRLTPQIEYNIYRISEIIPNDFENKVILLLTFHTGGRVGFKDEWLPFPLTQKLTVNNQVFGENPTIFTSGKQGKIANFMKSWAQFGERVDELICHVFSMSHQGTDQFNQLFNHQNEIMKNLAEYKTILEDIAIVRKSLSSPAQQTRVENWTETPHVHYTICEEHRTVCCLSCSLTDNGVLGTDFVNDCPCVNANKVCKVCGCLSEKHVHLYKKEIALSAGVRDLLQNKLTVTATDHQIILQELEKLELRLIEQLCDQEQRVFAISPRYKLS